MSQPPRPPRERLARLMGACVLLVTAIGASALLSAGTVQAAPCPGTAVAAGTTCTDTGTVNFTGGALTLVRD